MYAYSYAYTYTKSYSYTYTKSYSYTNAKSYSYTNSCPIIAIMSRNNYKSSKLYLF